MGQASVFSLDTQGVLGQLKTALEVTREQERRMVPHFIIAAQIEQLELSQSPLMLEFEPKTLKFRPKKHQFDPQIISCDDTTARILASHHSRHVSHSSSSSQR